MFASPETTPSNQDQTLFAIHNRLFFRLFQAGNALARQTVQEVGMTTVQWAVLGALSRQQASGGMTLAELQAYLGVSRQSLNGVLNRLDDAHHIERVVDAHDRRARRVKLTPEGRVFWKDAQPRIAEFYRRALAAFLFDDKVALVHFLNRLNTGLDAVNLKALAAGGAPSPGGDHAAEAVAPD